MTAPKVTREGRARQTNKRTPTQRVADRDEIARSYLRGEPQASIAKRLGISQQQVSFDLGLIRTQWQQSALRAFDDHKAQELAKLDQLEVEYWAGWERSCRELVHTTSEKLEDEISMPSGKRGVRIKVPRTRLRVIQRKEAQVGNSAFLFGVQRVIEARCKILGLFAAVDVQTTVTFGDLFALAQEDGEKPDIRVLPAG